jgi:hypothetical protein
MAQINKPNTYFNTKLYTGNGTDATSITGVGFQPDWVWIKSRVDPSSHNLFDSIRGATKRILSNSSIAENTVASTLQSFDADGFTVGTGGDVNTNSFNYASWNWKANGAGSANTDGSISSTVSANTTSGFSIVKWTGNSSASATVGHGLGTTPAVIITKELNGADWWHVWHKDLTNPNNIFLNTDSIQQAPTDGTISNVGLSTFGFQGATNVVAVNESGIDNIGYCFTEKKGYSKFGSYIGNGINGDGTFVYTGFKPSFILIKNADEIKNWYLYDTTRDTVQPLDLYLSPNLNNAEASFSAFNTVDALSNGFKLRGGSTGNGSETNNTGKKYISRNK